MAWRATCPDCGTVVNLKAATAPTPRHRAKGGRVCDYAAKPVNVEQVSMSRAKRNALARQKSKPVVAGPAADPDESKGRRPGLCPICRAKVAYDDELLMNAHLFKGLGAECPASDRPYGWRPEAVEDVLPRRNRGGGPVPAADLAKIRSAVTRLVAIKRDSERQASRAAARAKATKEAEKARERERIRRRQARGLPKETVRCVACGLDFERPAGDSTRRCGVCEPQRGKSLRAFGGGAPGLGKRH